jgi:hypothetical protein
MTWAPFSSGQTTLRASGGIFHGWLSPLVVEQTVRFDGARQQEVLIVNPPYPNPGAVSAQSPTNVYRVGDSYRLGQNFRVAWGIDHVFSPRLRVSVLHSYLHQNHQPRGRNLNAPVNGARPDSALGNVIEAVTDAAIRRYDLSVTMQASMARQPPGRLRDWRQLSVRANYGRTDARSNANGPFGAPPSGTLETEWGPGAIDNPYRLSLALVSNQIPNLTSTVSVDAADGSVYTETTGTDDNADGILSDRPLGIGLRGLRTSRHASVNLVTQYSWLFPQTSGRQPRLNLSVSVQNLFNRSNFVGFSGAGKSPYFRKPTAIANPRRVELSTTVSF